MSDEITKDVHSRRILQKENYAKKQKKIAKAYNIPPPKSSKHCETAVLNCGNPNCVMCGNPRKIWNNKTLQEKSFDQTMKWIEE
jgi:hypothetical protein